MYVLDLVEHQCYLFICDNIFSTWNSRRGINRHKKVSSTSKYLLYSNLDTSTFLHHLLRDWAVNLVEYPIIYLPSKHAFNFIAAYSSLVISQKNILVIVIRGDNWVEVECRGHTNKCTTENRFSGDTIITEYFGRNRNRNQNLFS